MAGNLLLLPSCLSLFYIQLEPFYNSSATSTVAQTRLLRWRQHATMRCSNVSICGIGDVSLTILGHPAPWPTSVVPTKSKSNGWCSFKYLQPEQLSDNETEYDFDLEDAEADMNNLPSPTHRLSSYYTAEYEARRQARKHLWSPPYTPDPDLVQPSYSLQPSQRTPSPTIRRHQPSPSPFQRTSIPPSSQPAHQLRLRHPLKAKQRLPRVQPTLRSVRRPMTRSIHSAEFISLHNKKGFVVVPSAKGEARIASYNEYLRSPYRSMHPSSLALIRFCKWTSPADFRRLSVHTYSHSDRHRSIRSLLRGRLLQDRLTESDYIFLLVATTTGPADGTWQKRGTITTRNIMLEAFSTKTVYCLLNKKPLESSKERAGLFIATVRIRYASGDV